MTKINKQFHPDNYISSEYSVGTMSFSIVDTDRDEKLGVLNEKRKIPVRMYYPVNHENVTGLNKACLFSERKMKALMKAYHLKKMKDDMNIADYYENVPISSDTKFPLIMFSMGYNSYIESNTYLLCNLASHGYIVASVGHAYEAVENDYEDGSFDLFDKKINKMMYTSIIGALMSQNRLLKSKVDKNQALSLFDDFQNKYTPFIKNRVPEWKMDIEKALDEIKKRFSENIDFQNGIGASGHSLGGCLAYYLCKYNSEFSCGINIDGGLFGDYPESVMTKPFCQISCKENVNVETRPLINTSADTYHVVFDDMKHIGFTDAKFFIPSKSLSGKLDNEEMFRHLTYCHVNFFDKYLKKKAISFDSLPSDKVVYYTVNVSQQ